MICDEQENSLPPIKYTGIYCGEMENTIKNISFNLDDIESMETDGKFLTFRLYNGKVVSGEHPSPCIAIKDWERYIESGRKEFKVTW